VKSSSQSNLQAELTDKRETLRSPVKVSEKTGL
jgi:hypothetical protein